MIVILLNSYIALLALFVWLKFIPFNTFWKVSPAIVLVVLLVGLFIPMGWGAPVGPLVVARNSVAIVPSVSGEVVEVPVEANRPVKAGDVLLRIDPTTYDAAVRSLKARLQFAELRLSQMSQLQERGTGRSFDVEQRQAEVDQLKAELSAAEWNLDRTTVRAPADGYVTNLGLRPGARVTGQSPVMAFIEDAAPIVGMEVSQAFARYVEVGQPVEATFKFLPGAIYTGKVEAVLQAVASGQITVGGAAVAPTGVNTAPFVIRIALDDAALATRLPAGSTGTAAIYTDHVKAAHVIRKVVLRLTAILNYVNPL